MHIKTVYFIQLMGKKESVYPKSIIYIARTCKTTSLKIAKNLNSNCFSKKKKVRQSSCYSIVCQYINHILQIAGKGD